MASDGSWRCTCFGLRRAARHVTQAYDKALAPTGLRISQYSLLARLARSGPRSIQELADDLGLDRTTMGRNLRPLEREGLVTIKVDAQDRRGRSLQITQNGKTRLQQAEPLWVEVQARFRSVYGPDRSEALHAALDALIAVDVGQA